jgi:hypothetical protein
MREAAHQRPPCPADPRARPSADRDRAARDATDNLRPQRISLGGLRVRLRAQARLDLGAFHDPAEAGRYFSEIPFDSRPGFLEPWC